MKLENEKLETKFQDYRLEGNDFEDSSTRFRKLSDAENTALDTYSRDTGTPSWTVFL